MHIEMDIFIINTSALIDISEIEKSIRKFFPDGICINMFKIEQMINTKLYLNKDYSFNIKNYTLSLIKSFAAYSYSPILLIGSFSIDDIEFLKKSYINNFKSIIYIYSSDELLLNQSLNRVKYLRIYSTEYLTQYRNKRHLQYLGKKDENSNVNAMKEISDIYIDISICNPSSVLDSFFLN